MAKVKFNIVEREHNNTVLSSVCTIQSTLKEIRNNMMVKSSGEFK